MIRISEPVRDRFRQLEHLVRSMLYCTSRVALRSVQALPLPALLLVQQDLSPCPCCLDRSGDHLEGYKQGEGCLDSNCMAMK